MSQPRAGQVLEETNKEGGKATAIGVVNLPPDLARSIARAKGLCWLLQPRGQSHQNPELPQKKPGSLWLPWRQKANVLWCL